MTLWNTKFLPHPHNVISKSNNITINCGIFQREFISPLPFCLALVPLSNELDNITFGWKINHKIIIYVFFMILKRMQNDDEIVGTILFICLTTYQLLMGYIKLKLDSFLHIWLEFIRLYISSAPLQSFFYQIV